MIQERYVSFEVAKMLKEKGFDEPCRAVYEEKVLRINTLCDYLNSELSSYVCAPTHQMAMEWLRNTYHIHIVIQPISGKGYNGIMCDVSDFDDFNYISETDFFLHPEEAVEAALKHTLENLI